MKVIVASDHAGVSLRLAVVDHLSSGGVEVFDAGVSTPDVPIDYEDCAEKVAQAICGSEYDRGILVSETGIGMSIAANKLKGIRAAVCDDTYTAHQSRAHNNANILCLGEAVTTAQRAIGIVDQWLATEFEGGNQEQLIMRAEGGRLLGSKRHRFPNLNGTSPIFRIGVALCPYPSAFAPLLYAGHLEEGFCAAADAGFAAVELSLKSGMELDPLEMDRLLKVNNLSISAFATGRMCIEDGLCLANSNPEVQGKVIGRLKEIIVLAHRFGSAVIIGGIRGRFVGTALEQAAQRETAIESLQECIQLADRMNTQILLEPINRYETNFINTAQEGISFLDDIGKSSPKLLLDTYHMNIEEADICATIRTSVSRLGYIHVADNNRLAPGQGHIDFQSILETLLDIEYSGSVSAEILPIPDSATAMRLAGKFLQKQEKILKSEFIG